MMNHLEEAVAAFLRIADHEVGDDQLAHHRLMGGMHQLYGAIRAAELAGLPTSAIRKSIDPVRQLYATSPLYRRLQTWPRGYAGDFETIEYLCEGATLAAPGTAAYFVEYQGLHCVGAQQHRNKIEWQARQILATVLARPDTHILILGCGGSRDLRHCEYLLAGHDVHFYLNDCEPDALQHSIAHLPQLASRITAIHGNVFSVLNDFRRLAPFDLILAGGLFDYLSDRQLTRLLPRLFDLLTSTGQLCFTNIASGNPDRIMMEYLADWLIIERAESDIARIADDSGLSGVGDLTMARDPTGLTQLVTVSRKAEAGLAPGVTRISRRPCEVCVS